MCSEDVILSFIVLECCNAGVKESETYKIHKKGKKETVADAPCVMRKKGSR